MSSWRSLGRVGRIGRQEPGFLQRMKDLLQSAAASPKLASLQAGPDVGRHCPICPCPSRFWFRCRRRSQSSGPPSGECRTVCRRRRGRSPPSPPIAHPSRSPGHTFPLPRFGHVSAPGPLTESGQCGKVVSVYLSDDCPQVTVSGLLSAQGSARKSTLERPSAGRSFLRLPFLLPAGRTAL